MTIYRQLLYANAKGSSVPSWMPYAQDALKSVDQLLEASIAYCDERVAKAKRRKTEIWWKEMRDDERHRRAVIKHLGKWLLNQPLQTTANHGSATANRN